MEQAVQVLALVVAVAVVAGAARRVGVSGPLVLVVVGVVASFVPGVPEYELNPDLVLLGLLPPLLYAAALRTSLFDIRANRQAIGLLSVGAVVFTTVAVGLVTWLVVPGLPLAGGLAVGAVVAPPDAVAATAVARRVGMPRRIVSILEGESLVNDATALVALRTAVVAISSSVGIAQVGWDFVRAAGGGLLVGLLAAAGLAAVRRRVSDPVLDTTLSFVAPFLAYLPAEAVHGSGVLAVVVTGLLLGHKAPVLQSAASRVSEQTNWATIQFLLENTVFLLIGLQLRSVLEDTSSSALAPAEIALVCAAVLAATVLARAVWVFGSTAVYHYGPGRLREIAWQWRHAALVSWAGMRGVVTLAAVFVLPADTPERPVLVLAAFVVVAGTLLLQGGTLPALVRRLGLPSPDPAEDALARAALLNTAARAGLERLHAVRGTEENPDLVARLEERAYARADAAWERLGSGSDSGETPSLAYRRLRLAMLAAERDVVVAARRSGGTDDEVLRDVLAQLDAEESLLDRVQAGQATPTRELVGPVASPDRCEHLRAARAVTRPGTPDGCEECLRDGSRWVHLRLCLDCGHVGCCDSSPQRHASAHHGDTGHPVVRSFEPGEAWRWCFVDEQLG